MNENLIAYAAAYLLGGIPSGVILAYIFGGVNIRSEGSGSIGATNVLRVLKQKDPKLAKKIAILTVVCDVLKGILPILIAKFLGLAPATLWVMEIWVDHEESAAQMREFVSLIFPRRTQMVRLYTEQDRSLFARFNLETQLDSIFSREVKLPSGGRLVFNQTKTLTAIPAHAGMIRHDVSFV